MPVTNANQVKSKMRQTFKDIADNKAPQFVHAVISIGAAESKFYAPVEYSTLVNSQMMNVTQSGSQIIGEVSFNTDYAAYLEFNQNWKPRPVGDKKGPAWNPNARPGFLRWGFESPESQRAIEQAEKIFKV